MIYIDQYSTLSKIRSLNPFVKLAYFVVFIVTALLAKSLLFLAILTTFISVINLRYGAVEPKRYFKISAIPLGFILMGITPILFQKIDTKDYILGGKYLFNYGITHASLTESLKVIARGYAATSALLFLILNTPISHLMWMFRKLKFPELFIDLTGLIYRNIFTTLQLSKQIYTAQQSRLGYTDSRKRDFGVLISQTFILSVKKANDQYNGLESRCYNNNFRMLNQEFYLSKKSIIQLITVSVFISTTLILSFSSRWI